VPTLVTLGYSILVGRSKILPLPFFVFPFTLRIVKDLGPLAIFVPFLRQVGLVAELCVLTTSLVLQSHELVIDACVVPFAATSEQRHGHERWPRHRRGHRVDFAQSPKTT
jgi:hypothetical protein